MTRPLLPTLAASLFATSALADVPRVVTDIPPVQSLVAQVMGDLGTPAMLVRPGASPHGYALRPSEAAALQDADLVFWVGPGITPWLEGPIATLSPDANSIVLSETTGTLLLPLREGTRFEAHAHDGHADSHLDQAEGGHSDHDHSAEGHNEGDHDDHDEGHHDDDHDDHDEGHHEDHDDQHTDPHTWLDPANAQAWLGAIASYLAGADPTHAAVYTANAAAGMAELDAVIAQAAATLAPVQGTPYITFHDAYQYFEAHFGVPSAGAITLSDATPASAARIAAIRDTVADLGVACIFAEPQFNPALTATVLEGSDAGSATLDPLGASLDPGPDLYGAIILAMADAMADCLN